MEKDTLRHNIEDSLFRLRRLRDQIRLDLNLAGLEAKDRWRKLEPMVEQAEKLAEDVSDVSRGAISDIVDRVRHFAETIRRETRPPA